MGRVILNNSNMNFKSNDREYNFLTKALRKLPIKEMGLEHHSKSRNFVCKMGTMQSIMIYPETALLDSIWLPDGATRVHSTRDYQAFTFNDVDYYIYRKPKNHIRKQILI